jgi:hypothetical protein
MGHTLLSQAGLLAYLDNFRLFAGICLVCLVAALLLKHVKPGRPVVAH